MASLYDVIDEAVQHAEPSSLEASLAAAEALRNVLEGHETLQANPTEAALKELLAVLQQAAPRLREACWLLVTQHQTIRNEVRTVVAMS